MNSVVIFALICTTVGGEGPPMVMDMETAMSLAVERNRTLAARAISLEEARLVRRNAWINRYLPRLELSLTLPAYREYTTRQLNTETGAYEWYDRESRSFSGMLSMDVPLPTDGTLTIDFNGERWEDFPRDVSDYEDPTYSSSLSFTYTQPILDHSNGYEEALQRADIALEQAQLSYQQEFFELEYRVAQSFLSALRAVEQTRIDSLELVVASENALLGKQKLSSGLISRGDALELELQEATTRAGFISSYALRRGRLEDLLLILGLPLDSEIDLVPPPPSAQTDITLTKALNMALARRRELRIERYRLERAVLDIEQARQSAGVDLDLTVGVGITSRGTTFGPAWDGQSKDRSITVGFSVPLLDFGRGDITISSAELQHHRALIDMESTTESIIAEIRSTVRDVNSLKERRAVLVQALTVAEENYRIAQARFDAGSISSQRLLDAQLSLFRARTNLLTARIDLDQSLRRLQMVTLARIDELQPDGNTGSEAYEGK